jgi:pimeloyl-ACP methyl ester carboxylesterase
MPRTSASAPTVLLSTRHYFTEVHGRRIFYREAGDPAAPVVLLLHGAPASSFMFRDLIPLLDQLGVTRYAIYVQDYGAPIGWRLILYDPDAVTAVITQNGNAYVEGLVPSFWDPVWAYAADPTAQTEQPIRDGLTLDAIRWQYTSGEPEPALVSPDAWHHDYDALQRPGNLEVPLTLLRQYPSNLVLYPAIHEWPRVSAVPVLAVWGRNDAIFSAAGAEPFRTDAPDARIELLDGGHFLLEAHANEVAALMRDFLADALTTA